jgi:synaptobrevin family protein YKT6
MKITALLVLKSPGDSSASASASASGGGEQAVVLANASDVSHFGYFQRAAAREFILFVARTVALRTPAGSRQNVQHEGTSRPTSLPPPRFVPSPSLLRQH